MNERIFRSVALARRLFAYVWSLPATPGRTVLLGILRDRIARLEASI
jgi:hypothetical protein